MVTTIIVVIFLQCTSTKLFYEVTTLVLSHTNTVPKNYKPLSFMYIDGKVINKILVSKIQKYTKRNIHYDQMEFIQKWQSFSILKINQYKLS